MNRYFSETSRVCITPDRAVIALEQLSLLAAHYALGQRQTACVTQLRSKVGWSGPGPLQPAHQNAVSLSECVLAESRAQDGPRSDFCRTQRAYNPVQVTARLPFQVSADRVPKVLLH